MILNLIPLFFILIIFPLVYADGENIVMDNNYITYHASLDDDTRKQLQQKADSLFDMIQKNSKEMSLEERKKTYPVSSTGIDEQHAAVIVGIDPVYFTDELILHHFTWIREFLGDEINIVLVSIGYLIQEPAKYPLTESIEDINDGVGEYGGKGGIEILILNGTGNSPPNKSIWCVTNYFTNCDESFDIGPILIFIIIVSVFIVLWRKKRKTNTTKDRVS